MRTLIDAVAAVLLFVPLESGATRQLTAVPGCPDLDVLEAEIDTSPDFLNNLLLCFCKVLDEDKVNINCLYGSSLEHLDKAASAVRKANLTTRSVRQRIRRLRQSRRQSAVIQVTSSEITFQHIEFEGAKLPPFAELAPELENLEIRECTNFGELNVSEATFKGLETTLKNLTIDNCNLKDIPAAVADLNQLETLALPNNKITHIEASIFSGKKELNYLDLSGNFINNIDDGSFATLQKLETLIFGEHNFMNDTVLDAISSLKSLKVLVTRDVLLAIELKPLNIQTLDLSRADGIFEPPMDLFTSLTHLEELKLSGCSIQTLEPGAFASLKNLKQLDLRVNLIQNVSAYAFDGLSKLTRISLAGNYIRNIEKDYWVGLESLKEIDLGWNEIKELSPDALAPLSEHLETLNMRHNPLKALPSTNLTKLKSLYLSECPLETFGAEQLKDYPELETLELAKCNLTQLEPDAFVTQKHSLKALHLQRNRLKTLSPKILEDLESLEQLDISGNPFICDAEIAKFIFAVEDRYKVSAKEGKEFLLANANETLCDRPYSLRHQPLLSVDTNELQPYKEELDTTTALSTTTVDEEDTTTELTTPFTLPDIFIGKKTNETLFKEEPRREIYDLDKANDPKDAMEHYEGERDYAVPLTVIVIAIISAIAIVAVGLFMRKKRKVANEGKNGTKKNHIARMEDGMVEIELDSTTQIKK